MDAFVDDELIEASRLYLLDKRTTLWADWDLTRPERLEAAARWLAGETRAVLDRLEELVYAEHDG